VLADASVKEAMVTTVDIDPKAGEIARKYFNLSPNRGKVKGDNPNPYP
jgi:hypothetical protein